MNAETDPALLRAIATCIVGAVAHAANGVEVGRWAHDAFGQAGYLLAPSGGLPLPADGPTPEPILQALTAGTVPLAAVLHELMPDLVARLAAAGYEIRPA